MFGLSKLWAVLADLVEELRLLAGSVRRCREGLDAALGAAGEDPWRVAPAPGPAPAAEANGRTRKARVGP
jgi:hypothetical protein